MEPAIIVSFYLLIVTCIMSVVWLCSAKGYLGVRLSCLLKSLLLICLMAPIGFAAVRILLGINTIGVAHAFPLILFLVVGGMYLEKFLYIGGYVGLPMLYYIDWVLVFCSTIPFLIVYGILIWIPGSFRIPDLIFAPLWLIMLSVPWVLGLLDEKKSHCAW